MPVVSTRYEVIKQELADWNIVAISDTKEKKNNSSYKLLVYDDEVKVSRKDSTYECVVMAIWKQRLACSHFR